jgi:hypothetical protein
MSLLGGGGGTGGDVDGIPLHCDVCPKQPDFSDLSHLLTHLGSKGHLSAVYKVEVKGDVASREIIRQYRQWYADYNLDELMRERMSQKEKKKGTAGNAARRTSAGKPMHSGSSWTWY